jgi:hypothetical protein
MANWYATRDQVKRAGGLFGSDRHPIIDRTIEAVSDAISRQTRRNFIPKTATKLFRWPQRFSTNSTTLWLSDDLLSITTLKTQAQNTSPTTISSSDYFIEPNEYGPPYDRIEIDESSTASFESGDTQQRSISVLGSWGYSDNTSSAGTVVSGLSSDSAATSMVISDGALIDVGHTLLIESEQIFVTGVTSAAEPNSDLLDGALTADRSETVTVDSGSRYTVDEVILVDAEQMLITGISGNVLTVIRAYNSTTLAAHSNNQAVHVFRTLTIERGVNGTTAATHANSTAISKYVPEYAIQELTIAMVLAQLAQEGSSWGRQVGQGDGAFEFSGRSFNRYVDTTMHSWQRPREAAV